MHANFFFNNSHVILSAGTYAFPLIFIASASCHLLDTVTHSVSSCPYRMDGSFCQYRQQRSESANKRVACTPRLSLQSQCKSSKSLHSNRWSLFRFYFPWILHQHFLWVLCCCGTFGPFQALLSMRKSSWYLAKLWLLCERKVSKLNPFCFTVLIKYLILEVIRAVEWKGSGIQH